MYMSNSNTAALLVTKRPTKAKKPKTVESPSTPVYDNLPKRILDEYKCALLRPKSR